MQSDKTIIYQYNNILMGKWVQNPFKYIFEGNEKDQKKIAGIIWRYAISCLLGWTPDQALVYMDDEIIKALYLDLTYPYLGFDNGKDTYVDLREVLQYAYPDEIHFTLEDQAIREYERVSRKKKKGEKKERYHKNFFKNYEGAQRFKVIFNYAVSKVMDNPAPVDLFAFFADEEQAKKWLHSNNISKIMTGSFDSTLDICQECFEDEIQGNILYMNEILKGIIRDKAARAESKT